MTDLRIIPEFLSPLELTLSTEPGMIPEHSCVPPEYNKNKQINKIMLALDKEGPFFVCVEKQERTASKTKQSVINSLLSSLFVKNSID